MSQLGTITYNPTLEDAYLGLVLDRPLVGKSMKKFHPDQDSGGGLGL